MRRVCLLAALLTVATAPGAHAASGPFPLFYMAGRYNSFTTYQTDLALIDQAQP